VPFDFLKRHKADGGAGSEAGTADAAATAPGRSQKAGVRGVAFTALTEDWRLRGRMQIAGRLSDALNRREAIAISDVTWGAPDAVTLDLAPGLKSVDPYDLILVTTGEDSLPPLTDAERAAMKSTPARPTQPRAASSPPTAWPKRARSAAYAGSAGKRHPR